jgi:hypothetical protein
MAWGLAGRAVSYRRDANDGASIRMVELESALRERGRIQTVLMPLLLAVIGELPSEVGNDL